MPAQGGNIQRKDCPLEESHSGQKWPELPTLPGSVSGQRLLRDRVPDWQAEADLEGANCGRLPASHLHAWQLGHKSFLEGRSKQHVSVAASPILYITNSNHLKIISSTYQELT